jgi:hypothetical protein
MPDERKYEILNMVFSPPDFPSWSNDQKLDFYRRAVEWHVAARGAGTTAGVG